MFRRSRQSSTSSSATSSTPSRKPSTTTPPTKAADSKPDISDLEVLFLKYKDPDSSWIFGDGLVQLCNDLGIDPTDPVTLALAWKWDCDVGGVFKKDQFVQGMLRMGCHSIDQLRRQIASLRSELETSESSFKEFYKYVFRLTRMAQESDKKTLDVATSCVLLDMLLKPKYPVMVEDFKAFLHSNENRRLTDDNWNCFLEFCKVVKARTFNGYSEEDGWPLLLDEFVAWKRQH